MPQDRDELLLQEFKKALTRNASDPYANLDEKFLREFDFFANRYEEIMKITGSHIPPHKWSYHRIGLITKGQAEYTCGMYRFTAKENTLLVMPARMLTTSTWNPVSCGYLTLFNIDFLLKNNLSYKASENKAILQPTIKPYLILSPEQCSRIEMVFKAILQEKEADNSFKNELIALKIVELLILCDRFYAEVNDMDQIQDKRDLLKKFTELVELHFMEQRSVNFYASSLHVHPNHLNAVIKASTGITAKESIQSRILLEAKFLLHTTDLSVKEIAHRTGFDDPNYFNVFFKRLEKTTPASYRACFI